MTATSLIKDQLEKAQIIPSDLDLDQTDIVALMFLEFTKCLEPLEGIPLKCSHRMSNQSDAIIAIGLEDHDFLPNEGARDKLNEVLFQLANPRYKQFKHITNQESSSYCFQMPNEYLERAVRSSSLFIAAGDLTRFTLDELIELRLKLYCYQSDASNRYYIDNAISRVDNQIEQADGYEGIGDRISIVREQLQTKRSIEEQERRFNKLYLELNVQIARLSDKGCEYLQSGEANPWFNHEYREVANAALTLANSLECAADEFFNNPPTLESVLHFQSQCMSAINSAKEEFSRFRNGSEWYSALEPVLRGFLVCGKALVGIIAGLTIIPAVLTEFCAPQGYIGTFFQTKTASSKVLESFEQKFLSSEGIMGALDTISFNSMV